MFRAFRSIRLVLAAVVLIPMGFFLAWTAMFGAGHVVVVAPEEGPVSVAVDGAAEQVIARGTHQKLELKQGRHALKLTGAQGSVERAVEAKSGFADLLVPSDDQQCFVLLDVSKSHYQFGSKPAAKLPVVARRITAKEVFDLPGSTYFSEQELPRSIKESASANLLLEADCASLTGDDQALFKALGL